MRYAPLVAKLAIVAELSEVDAQTVISLCDDERLVPAKRDILTEGDRPDHVHVIIDGWAARYKTLSEGSRQIVGFLIPGDFCDLDVPILGRMDHGIGAVPRGRIAYIPRSKLDQVTSGNVGLLKALWWATLVDESILREWLLNVGRRESYARIAHLFCELHLRMQMIGLVKDNRFALPLTQEQVADATGLTAVHVNRMLQTLRGKKLIELGSGYLTILDLEGLRQAAGFNGSYLHTERRIPELR